MQDDSIVKPNPKEHSFRGEVDLFATKHRKEETLGPLLSDTGMRRLSADIDPDRFETFTSEGSFGPQAIIDCSSSSATGRVIIANDLRACHNSNRRSAIFEAGKVLLEKLKSFCPFCSYPGFSITKGILGLNCSGCGEPSQIAKAVLFECACCAFSEERKRPGGKRSIATSECEFCNP